MPNKKKKDFVLDVVKTANKVYPDGLVHLSHLGEEVGDGLAEFIAREIQAVSEGTKTRKAAFEAADAALTTAAKELDAVIAAIRKKGNS